MPGERLYPDHFGFFDFGWSFWALTSSFLTSPVPAILVGFASADSGPMHCDVEAVRRYAIGVQGLHAGKLDPEARIASPSRQEKLDKHDPVFDRKILKFRLFHSPNFDGFSRF